MSPPALVSQLKAALEELRISARPGGLVGTYGARDARSGLRNATLNDGSQTLCSDIGFDTLGQGSVIPSLVQDENGFFIDY